MKKFLCWALILALNSPLYSGEPTVANYTYTYDLDATSVTYCKVVGHDGTPFGTGISVTGKIATSGSSATTTEVADTDPFTGIGVGDILIVDKGTGAENALVRVVATATSVSSVAVNSAWDLETDQAGNSGYFFKWRDLRCGTAATDGWIDVSAKIRSTIVFQLDQVNVTGGVDVRIECRDGFLGAAANQVFPQCASGSCNTYQNYTTAGIASRTKVVIDENWSQCRVGLKIGSADDGGDTGANAEQITIGLVKEN
jgi:hypothetical protein